jgi:hypothetical protein
VPPPPKSLCYKDLQLFTYIFKEKLGGKKRPKQILFKEFQEIFKKEFMPSTAQIRQVLCSQGFGRANKAGWRK